jgi:hypothetical protein
VVGADVAEVVVARTELVAWFFLELLAALLELLRLAFAALFDDFRVA